MKAAAVWLAMAALLGMAVADQWNSNNNPALFSSSYNYKYSSLPTSGTLKQLPWSDTYWPSFQSGIAHRWYSSNPSDFTYTLNDLTALKKMSLSQMKALSPAEKYDIYMGRYDYPTVQSEWQRTSPQDATWEGLCHGWAPASLYYVQPNPVTLTNKDGVAVPFGSSDIKALLTYFVAEYDELSAPTKFIAERCNYDISAKPSMENTTACADMNAGSLHIILTNQLSSSVNTGFVVDRDRSIQVWNQPVCKVSSKVISSSSTQVVVQTAMTYGKETVPQWDAHPPYLITETYEYALSLNNGNVVGGTYYSWDRPDFGWMVQINPFSGYLSSLQTVYQSSINATTVARSEEVFDFADALDELPNHTDLTELSGTIATETYPANYRQSWSIRPSNGANTITLNFSLLDTERYRDKLRVYEGADREGALVAVLHGSSLPSSITIDADGAYLVFTSDRSSEATHKGFALHYVVN